LAERPVLVRVGYSLSSSSLPLLSDDRKVG
jgi:hypothetical protein